MAGRPLPNPPPSLGKSKAELVLGASLMVGSYLPDLKATGARGVSSGFLFSFLAPEAASAAIGPGSPFSMVSFYFTL